MPLIEEVPEIVKVTTTMIPALRNVRLIRGLIVPLADTGGMNEIKALDKLEEERRRKVEERRKLKKKHNKRVIKVSDAMECVERYAFDGRIVLDFTKAVLNVITSGVRGGIGQDLGDIMFGRIAGCMIGKALQQRNRRSKGKYVKTKGPGLPEGQTFTELVRLRRGKLHPFIPHNPAG